MARKRIAHAWLISLAVSILAACAGQGEGPAIAVNSTKAVEKKDQTASAYTPPANYRALIIGYLKATEYAPYIRRAYISRPYEEWMGLVNGGSRLAVCVEVYRETPLFAEGRDIWIFGFENGKISTAGFAYPGPGCKDLAPLNEVARPKK